MSEQALGQKNFPKAGCGEGVAAGGQSVGFRRPEGVSAAAAAAIVAGPAPPP